MYFIFNLIDVFAGHVVAAGIHSAQEDGKIFCRNCRQRHARHRRCRRRGRRRVRIEENRFEISALKGRKKSLSNAPS